MERNEHSEPQDDTIRFELSLGEKIQDEIRQTLPAGRIFKNDSEDYYRIKLMMFPGQTYYLCRNRDSESQFTIFSRLIRSGKSVKFINPVGSGRLDSRAKTHLEIRFPILGATLYMNLYPI